MIAVKKNQYPMLSSQGNGMWCFPTPSLRDDTYSTIWQSGHLGGGPDQEPGDGKGYGELHLGNVKDVDI